MSLLAEAFVVNGQILQNVNKFPQKVTVCNSIVTETWWTDSLQRLFGPARR
jgi:hypothetical protein